MGNRARFHIAGKLKCVSGFSHQVNEGSKRPAFGYRFNARGKLQVIFKITIGPIKDQIGPIRKKGVGKGTTFAVCLPFAAVDSESEEKTRSVFTRCTRAPKENA